MALFAVFQPDPLSLARIRQATAGVHELSAAADWQSFREALATLPLDGCILDLYAATEPVPLSEIHAIRERHPSLAIVVHADFRGHEMDLFTLGRLGVDGVVPSGRMEAMRDIQGGLDAALVSSLAQRVLRSLRRTLPRLAGECLAWAIERCHHAPAVHDLAEAFGRSAAGLAHGLRREGAPSAGRLLLWGRLIRAAHMLANGARVEGAAYAVGYSSAAALSRAFRRETGYPAVEVMRRGGLGCVLDALANREIRRPAAPPAGARWRPSEEPRTLPRGRRGRR